MKKLNFIYSLGIVEMRIMGFYYTATYLLKNWTMPKKLSKHDFKKLQKQLKVKNLV